MVRITNPFKRRAVKQEEKIRDIKENHRRVASETVHTLKVVNDILNNGFAIKITKARHTK